MGWFSEPTLGFPALCLHRHCTELAQLIHCIPGSLANKNIGTVPAVALELVLGSGTARMHSSTWMATWEGSTDEWMNLACQLNGIRQWGTQVRARRREAVRTMDADREA